MERRRFGMALDGLAEAIRIRPMVAEWAREDDDLESLRDDPAFQEMVDRRG